MDHCSKMRSRLHASGRKAKRGPRRLAGVVAALLLACSGIANAGYAQVSPPPGWSAAGGGNGSMTFPSAAANAPSYSGGVGRAAASFNTGGQAVKVPAAYRFAANAGRFAARGIVLNPGLAVGVAAIWLAQKCIKFHAGQWTVSCGPGMPPQSDGWRYQSDYPPDAPWEDSMAAACSAASPMFAAMHGPKNSLALVGVRCGQFYEGVQVGLNNINKQTSSCPAGWYVTPAGCVQTSPPQPITPHDVEERMAPQPIPDGLPEALPGVPLPIEQPIINPSPEPNPRPQPMVIPQGLPIPVPDTNPQKFRQPIIEVTPAPAPGQPWRVDVQPGERVGTDPSGVPDPPGDLDGSPKKTVEQSDICAKDPDILACQKLDRPDAEDLETKDKQIVVSMDSGWGAENAPCPAPRHLNVQGRDIPIPLDLICQYMSGIRPVIIALAWLSAGFILLGARGND